MPAMRSTRIERHFKDKGGTVEGGGGEN